MRLFIIIVYGFELLLEVLKAEEKSGWSVDMDFYMYSKGAVLKISSSNKQQTSLRTIF